MGVFKIDPRMDGNTLSQGKQRDTYNCGPAAGNTIEYNVFGKRIWSHNTAVEDRMEWFLRLSAWTDDGCNVCHISSFEFRLMLTGAVIASSRVRLRLCR